MVLSEQPWPARKRILPALRIIKASDLIISGNANKTYFYPPLELKLSDYPDFTADKHDQFQSSLFPFMKPVEIDLYNLPEQPVTY